MTYDILFVEVPAGVLGTLKVSDREIECQLGQNPTQLTHQQWLAALSLLQPPFYSRSSIIKTSNNEGRPCSLFRRICRCFLAGEDRYRYRSCTALVPKVKHFNVFMCRGSQSASAVGDLRVLPHDDADHTHV